MSSATPVNNSDDICQRCSYTRWAHENAVDILPAICTNFEEPQRPDPLEREPIFNFAEFRNYCEGSAVNVGDVDAAFVVWLHTRPKTASIPAPPRYQ